uniref:Uncharacterized protein n=1 Tax=Citrobacter freundii TaxID=546 RepID=A0A3S5I477_CITFR|nr:hypothetical protein [Citrobacter freundii]
MSLIHLYGFVSLGFISLLILSFMQSKNLLNMKLNHHKSISEISAATASETNACVFCHCFCPPDMPFRIISATE